MRRISILALVALFAMSAFGDVTNRPNASLSNTAQNGSVTVTTTDANGNVTIVSFTALSTPSSASSRPTAPAPPLPNYVMNSQLLYRAAMASYCSSNISGCGPIR